MHDVAALRLDRSGDQVEPGGELFVRADLVLTRQAAVPSHVGIQDRGQLACDGLFGHAPPSTENAPAKA